MDLSNSAGVSAEGPVARELLVVVERSLRASFGVEPARASVSFVGVEPIEILRFDTAPDAAAYVSLGMSRRPMTASDAKVVGATGPRAEILVQVHGGSGGLWRQLAVLAAAPAVEGVVYAAGMTIDLGASLATGSRCTGVVVASSALPPVAWAGLEVEIMQMLPATSTELAWSRVHGTDSLRERWESEGIDLLDLGRPSAHFS
jgi:hypothetical protein